MISSPVSMTTHLNRREYYKAQINLYLIKHSRNFTCGNLLLLLLWWLLWRLLLCGFCLWCSEGCSLFIRWGSLHWSKNKLKSSWLVNITLTGRSTYALYDEQFKKYHVPVNEIQTSELSACGCTGRVTGNGCTWGFSPAFLPELSTCGGGGWVTGIGLGFSWVSCCIAVSPPTPSCSSWSECVKGFKAAKSMGHLLCDSYAGCCPKDLKVVHVEGGLLQEIKNTIITKKTHKHTITSVDYFLSCSIWAKGKICYWYVMTG